MLWDYAREADQSDDHKPNPLSLRTFLLNFEVAYEVQEDDIKSWIKRYASDNDGGLRFPDLVNAMQTMTNY